VILAVTLNTGLAEVIVDVCGTFHIRLMRAVQVFNGDLGEV
jgi:hypothetical protein